jgi:hypothetical protein
MVAQQITKAKLCFLNEYAVAVLLSLDEKRWKCPTSDSMFDYYGTRPTIIAG